MQKYLVQFIILEFVVIGLCGLVYTEIQQVLRQSANYPQIQLAQDAAANLEQTKPLKDNEPVNLNASLAPFVMVFDENNKVIIFNTDLYEHSNHFSISTRKRYLISS